MQKNNAKYFTISSLLTLAYCLYISMSDIYPILPPFIGTLFVIFNKNYDASDRIFTIICIIFCTSFFELNKLLIFGMLPILFFIVRFFIVRRFEDVLQENILFAPLYVIVIYVFYGFSILTYYIWTKTSQDISYSLIFFYFIMDCIGAIMCITFIFKEKI